MPLFKKWCRANYGEKCAARYLRRKGYRIIDKNFRAKCGELDLIALKDNILVIAEVKQRGDNALARPALSVNKEKQRKIKMTTELYLMKNNIKLNVRFDVVEVMGDKCPEINHIIGAFK